jgi:hypothetical protein
MTPATLRELASLVAGMALIARGLMVEPPDATLIALGVGMLGVTPVLGGRSGRAG